MQFTKALQHTIGWKALNTILIFFINLLLVRILGANVSGAFFYSIALLAFLILLISWSMEAGITYYGSANPDSLPSITLFLIPWMIVQAVVAWIILGFLPIGIHRQLAWIYVLSSLAIIYFSALYYAKKWFISINIILCVVNCFVLIGLGWVYAIYGNGPEKLLDLLKEKMNTQLVFFSNTNAYYLACIAYFGGFLLQALILAIAFFIKSRTKIMVAPFKPSMVRKVFQYSSIAFISNILFFLVTRIDYYFVEKYCSEIALGNYVQVSKMGQLLILLPTMMAGVIFPYSSGGDDRGHLTKLQFLCRIIGLLFIPAAFMIILLGFWLFPWLFGNGFTMMYPAMLLYLPGFYFLSLVALLAAHLAGRAMLAKNMIASGITLIAVIAGDVLLIPVGGIYAAAAVSTISYFLCLIYLLRVYKMKLDCKPGSFIVIRQKDIQLILNNFKK